MGGGGGIKFLGCFVCVGGDFGVCEWLKCLTGFVNGLGGLLIFVILL